MATDATDQARDVALRRRPPLADVAAPDPLTRPPLAGVADAHELAALERIAAWAPNTRRAYTAAWKRWTAWAAARGVAALPADARHVRAYILDRAAAGRVDATLRMDAAGIAAVHEVHGAATPCPPRGLVSTTLARLAKQPDRARPQRQAEGLTTDALAAIRATACLPRRPQRSRETREQARRRGLVDIALVGILSDAGLRRSECAALTWSDIEAAPDGSGRVTIARSKTDQTAEGRVVAITAATMAALAATRPELPAAAPVFGLSADRIARRVKAAARAAGLGDAYSGHSGRVGMARRMVAAGAPVAAVIRQGRWSERSGGAMVARYTRREDAAEALRYL